MTLHDALIDTYSKRSLLGAGDVAVHVKLEIRARRQTHFPRGIRLSWKSHSELTGTGGTTRGKQSVRVPSSKFISFLCNPYSPVAVVVDDDDDDYSFCKLTSFASRRS